MTLVPRKRISAGRPAGAKSFDPIIAGAFGEAVVSLRVAYGISQESLAIAASIGQSNLSAIENGHTSPTFAGAVRIATALGCGLVRLVEEFELIYKAASASKPVSTAEVG